MQYNFARNAIISRLGLKKKTLNLPHLALLPGSFQLLATELTLLTAEQMGLNAPLVYGRLSNR